jgi:hypothetical protein
MSTPEITDADREDDAETAVISKVYGDAPPEAAAGGPQDAVEALPPAEAWLVFRRSLWAYYMAYVRQEAGEAVHALEARVRDGERPTREEVRDARRAVRDLEDLVDQYAVLASG